jgi:hypothetical protein
MVTVVGRERGKLIGLRLIYPTRKESVNSSHGLDLLPHGPENRSFGRQGPPYRRGMIRGPKKTLCRGVEPRFRI